jgi:O-antigen/teichoic acid export membrane protein
VHYFAYQLSLSILEIFIFRAKQFSAVPLISKSSYRFYWGDVKPTLPFAMGIAYTAGVWIFITQVDKAILSSVLTLTEFGYYSLVALVVGGILRISQPLLEAIRPRMTALAEGGRTEELHALYFLGTQIIAAISFSASFVIAFNAKSLIYLWTGNQDAAIWG